MNDTRPRLPDIYLPPLYDLAITAVVSAAMYADDYFIGRKRRLFRFAKRYAEYI